MQDENRILTQLGSTTPQSSKSEDSSTTPPEAWGGEKVLDKYAHIRQPLTLPSRLGTLAGSQTSGSMFSFQDFPSSVSPTSISSLTNSNFDYTNLRSKDASNIQETPLGYSELPPSSSLSLSFGPKGVMGQTTVESSGTASLTLPRRLSTYAERISTTSSFSDGPSISVGSPKTKKTGVETKEELLSSLLSRSQTSAALEPGTLPTINVSIQNCLCNVLF